jgi:hypothetical protein
MRPVQVATGLLGALSVTLASLLWFPGMAAAAPLPCSAHMANSHPTNFALAVVIVRTTPHARIIATQHIDKVHTTQYGFADSQGVGSIDFKISFIVKRTLRTVTVVVRKGSLSGRCRTSFDPV